MGYTTDFEGQFDLDEQLTLDQVNELNDFAEEGHEGPDFPGHYCQWVPSRNGKAIVWDGNEKFYDYVPWLEYLIEERLQPWGRVLNGTVTWQGEESGDFGKIIVTNNVVDVQKGRKAYESTTAQLRAHIETAKRNAEDDLGASRIIAELNAALSILDEEDSEED